jgi:membrane-associated protease RseP (regulator of RpoE activity)
MSAPKHLWSGDWESDSAAARERAALWQPPEQPEPEPKPEQPPPRRERRRFPWPRMTTVLLAGTAVLVLAGAAFGVSRLGGSNSPAGHVTTGPWLGLNLSAIPVNRVQVVGVTPGSPADRAGIGAGDVILSVGGHAVAQPGDVSAAIAKLRAGDTVKIQLQRGPVIVNTEATLARQPANSP